jgi:hypothetical protein
VIHRDEQTKEKKAVIYIYLDKENKKIEKLEE